MVSAQTSPTDIYSTRKRIEMFIVEIFVVVVAYLSKSMDLYKRRFVLYDYYRYCWDISGKYV